jgi:hypothetical protein
VDGIKVGLDNDEQQVSIKGNMNPVILLTHDVRHAISVFFFEFAFSACGH